MSQSGFTPIQLYSSSTAAALPIAGNLAAGELAINTVDEKLYFKNSAGVVKLLASNAAAAGTVSSVAATVPSFLSVTGSPITTSGTLAIAYSGTALPVANGGSGTATPSLVAGSNVTISGTWPNQTVASTAAATAATPAAIGSVYGCTAQSQKVSIGYQSNANATLGSVYVGWQAGQNTTANNNTIVGAFSGQNLTTGTGNVAVGQNSLNGGAATTDSVAIGAGAMLRFGAGSCNVAVGQSALQGGNATASNNTGDNNVAVGTFALLSLTSGSYNTVIGNSSGFAITTGSKNVILGGYGGNQFGLDIRTLNNYLVLSDGDGNPRIYHNGTTVVIPNLPTSATGLPTGGLWKCAGTLKVA